MSALGARVLNDALERETWARERLSAHAGRTFSVRAGPAVETFHIAADGRLDAATAEPDLTLSLSPLHLASLLAAPQRWSEWVEAEGDPALAATLSELAQTLPWFVEASFSRVLGPVVGMRAAALGQRLLAFPEQVLRRFADSAAAYVRDETPVGVSAAEARARAEDIDALAKRAEALAARVDGLLRPAAIGTPSEPA